MATGDQSDLTKRITTGLPTQWFPPGAPRIGAQIAGGAAAFAVNYGQIAYTALQTRVATLTDGYADLAAQDYTGGAILRRTNESDASLTLRTRNSVLQLKQTRQAVIDAVETLTGYTPWIFVPTYPADTGGYGHSGMTAGTGLAYGEAGGYGSLELPCQFFIIAYRTTTVGLPGVMGYYYGSGWAGGGYGVGAIEYATLAMAGDNVTDAQIYAAVAGVLAAGFTAWMAITNGPP
jgi:hypothetical protein